METLQFINFHPESDDPIKYAELPGSINPKNLHYQEERSHFDTMSFIDPIIRMASLNLRTLSLKYMNHYNADPITQCNEGK